MSGSILVDWQVACQLGLQPREMRSFLLAMEVLRRPDSNNAMSAVRALDELGRLERWAHIYVLPIACRELRRLGSAFSGTEALCRRLIDPIVEGATGEVRDFLRSTIAGLIGSELPSALLPKLEAVAASVASDEFGGAPNAISEGGYLDIEEYDLTALLLSIALVLAGEARNEVSQGFGKGQAETAKATSLATLLLRVLQGEQGRWCRLLGVDLVLAVPELASREALADSLQSSSPQGLAMAPDLLTRLALLEFGSRASDPEAKQLLLDRLYRELLTFTHWQSLAGKLLDPEASREEVQTSLVYWQDALWHIMTDLDAREAAMRLQQVWLPRVIEPPTESDRIAVPVDRKALPTIARLHKLLGQQHSRQDRGPQFASGKLDDVSSYWWALSPWMVVDPPPRSPGERRRQRTRPQILACAAAAAFETRLLLQAGPITDISPPWRYFAAHLLHALQELRRYRYVDERLDRQPDKKERHLFVLAHICRVSAEKVAGGRMLYPEPSLFVDLLEDAVKNGLVDTATCPQAVVVSGRETTLRDSLLASCLRLAEYAMGAAADGGRKRWLDLISRLSSLPGHQTLEEPDSLLRKLLMRFLLKSPPSEVAIEDGLSRIVDSQSWKNTNRRLLLVPADKAEAWVLSGAPAIPEDEDFEASALSLACQRVAAALQDNECHPDLRHRWLQDFELLMNRLRSGVPLDRFLRLRLIELLRGDLLAPHGDIVSVVASRLIEFGSALDLQQIAEWLTGERVASKAQADVRHRLFLGMLRYRRRRTETNAMAEEPGGDPDIRLDTDKRLELVDRLISCCLSSAGEDQQDFTKQMGDWARAERDAVFAGHLAESGTRIPLQMDHAGRFGFAEKGGRLQARALVVTVDRNSEQAHVLDPTAGQYRVCDLFSGGTPDSAAGQFCLGVIEELDDSNGLDASALIRLADQQSFRVNRRTLPRGCDLGALVAVRHQGGAFRGESVNDIQCLPPPQASFFRSAQVSLGGEDQKRLDVLLESRGDALNWIRRTNNFLALHGGLKPKVTYGIWVSERRERVRTRSNGTPRNSAILDFVDLLLDYPRIAEGGSALVACLHQLERDVTGDPESVVIEAMPLQRYSLRLRTDLTQTARKQIEEQIALIEGTKGEDAAAGLLITMHVVKGLDGPRLELAASGANLPCLPQYTVGIAKPFDDRNICWRDLFKDGEDEEDDRRDDDVLVDARLDASGKVLAELKGGVAGFPQEIEIDVKGRPRSAIHYVWLDPDSWKPWIAQASGVIAQASTLERLGDQPYEVIRSEVLGLKEGDIIELARFYKLDEQSGNVIAFTNHNLMVRVAAESLSMLPFPADQLRENAGIIPRRARLSYVVERSYSTAPQIPPESLSAILGDDEQVLGVLIGVPPALKDRTSGSVTGAECEVAWLREGTVVQGRLPIQNLSDFQRPRLEPGVKVIVRMANGRPEAKFERRDLSAEALWEEAIENADQEHSRHNYIGSARKGGQACEIYQVRGGRFVAQPLGAEAKDSGSELSKFRSQIPALDPRVRDVSTGRSRGRFGSELLQRCVLQFDGTESRLCGLRRSGDPVGEAYLVGLDLMLEEVNAEVGARKYFTIRRRFRLQLQHRPIVVEQRAPTTPVRSAKDFEFEQQKVLTLWMEKKTVLEGEHDLSRNALRFQSRERRLFRDGISIEPDQLTWGHRDSVFRSLTARAVLIQNNPPLASYRAAPPLSLEFLQAALGAPLGEAIRLGPDLELYHVRVLPAENAAGEQQQAEYVFEWGYGFWISLPESQLRYKGGAIRTGELRLFVEDQVAQVRFFEERGLLVLSIEETIPSPGHVLYRQAQVHQIIHPLHVQIAHSGEPEIVQIEGFDSAGLGEPRRPMRRDGGAFAPQLDEAGKQIARERAQTVGPGSRWEGIILGRLDTDAFMASHGAELRFQYVRLDLTARNGAGNLKNGDRIFAIGGEVVSHGRNDCALILRPLADAKDVSSEFREMRVLRRQFSYRQQTLLRLYREQPDALRDRHVLVQIVSADKGYSVSLRAGSPARHQAALDTLLAASETGLFAIYAGSIKEEGIRLEFKPGVIVNLPLSQVNIADDLVQGDVVRISASPRNSTFWIPYVVERAMYSDIRYAARRRPVVALPMQNLFRARPPYSDARARRAAADSFTIGDLPDLRVQLRMPSGDGRLRVPNDDELMRFMAAEHPKFAWLQEIDQDADKRPVASIVPEFRKRIRAGRLSIPEPGTAPTIDDSAAKSDGFSEVTNSLPRPPGGLGDHLRFEPLENSDASVRDIETDWHLLTFQDQPADWLQKNIAHVSWAYHDKESICWTSDPASPSRNIQIREATIHTGPLFVEESGGKGVLRYRSDDLPNYAVGFGNLIAMLPNESGKGGRLSNCVVAGVPKEGGLYVEVLPGRIIEIPPAMVQWGQVGQDPVSLDLLDWQQFAAGDRLDIRRLPQGDPYTPERVLLHWSQGVRNAFGPIGAILPRKRCDEGRGAAYYGCEGVDICLPSTNPVGLPEFALVGGKDILQALASDSEPIRHSTVFLVERDNGIGVAGLDQWRASPDRHWDWNTDSLMQSIMRPRADGIVMVDWPQVRERIKLAGGALPVTVEGFYRPNGSAAGTLYFSRRYQDPAVPIGRTALARMVGQLSGSSWTLLSIGGRHITLPTRYLVLGLPDELRAAAVETLRESNTPIWIRSTKDGYRAGVTALDRDAPLVRPQLILGNEAGDALGIICVGVRDRRLRWLPAHRAAVAPLTSRQAALAFASNGRAFQLWKHQEEASIIDHPRVRRELDNLTVGERLGVELVPRNIDASHRLWGETLANQKLRLVRSRATGLIMAAAGAEKAPEGFMAEVSERRSQDGQLFLLLVAAGKRRIRPDFPAWITDISDQQEPSSPQEFSFLIDATMPQPGDCREIVRAFSIFLRSNKIGMDLERLIHFSHEYCQLETASLLSGISAAVLLAGCAPSGLKSVVDEQERALIALLDHIGRSAVQSYHLELLVRRWKERRTRALTETPGVTARIDSLLSAVRANANIDVCNVAVNRLFDHITLNYVPEYDVALVNAVAGGLGRAADLKAILQSSEYVADTVRAVRLVMMLRHPPISLRKAAVSALTQVGERMLANAVDVPLHTALR